MARVKTTERVHERRPQPSNPDKKRSTRSETTSRTEFVSLDDSSGKKKAKHGEAPKSAEKDKSKAKSKGESKSKGAGKSKGSPASASKAKGKSPAASKLKSPLSSPQKGKGASAISHPSADDESDEDDDDDDSDDDDGDGSPETLRLASVPLLNIWNESFPLIGEVPVLGDYSEKSLPVFPLRNEIMITWDFNDT